MFGLFLQRNRSAKAFCCTILRERIQFYRIIHSNRRFVVLNCLFPIHDLEKDHYLNNFSLLFQTLLRGHYKISYRI